jgi:DHA3 family macrolide efflux protein-like MFS transporter
MFLAGQWISMLGSAMVQFAIIFHITLAERSGTVMFIAALCNFLPQVLVSPMAGVWADRYDRKRLIILADSGIALATLLIAVLFLLEQASLWMVLALSAVRAIGSGVQSPAVSALLPQLVPEEHLLRVNGANGSMQSLILLLCPALGGWLLAMGPLAAVLMLDVVTAATGIALLLAVPVPRPAHQDAPSRPAPWYDLAEGLRYALRTPFVRVLLLFYAAYMFLMAPAAQLTPLLVTRTFGGGEWNLALNEIFFSGGSLLGGLVIMLWGGFKNKVHTMGAASALMGAFVLALGLPVHFTLYLAFMLLCGISSGGLNAPAITLLQEHVRPDMMGRVFSLVSMIATLCLPVGMAVFGPLADVVPVQTLLLFTGAAMVLTGGLMAASRTLREAAAQPNGTGA